MVWFLTLCRLCQRAKYFLLLVAFLSFVAWITSFSSDIVRETTSALWWSPNPDVFGLQGKAIIEAPKAYAPDSPVQHHCSFPSALLLGSLQLVFPSSLTIKQVVAENKDLVEGQFSPKGCQPQQSVAILIPHRNREKHLMYLLYHLHPFLQRQQLRYAVYVIHQAGNAMFNRAKLLNIGYLEALKDYKWDCFIFHDVDLVPENDFNMYMCGQHPKHLVVGRNVTGYKLRYKGYFGGVTAMTKEQFFKVNGFSNNYWGWGGEDDDLRLRVEIQKMKITRPPHDVARYTMVFHNRDSGNEINQDRMLLLSKTKRVWAQDGLNSCKYEKLSVVRSPLYINVTVDVGNPPAHV